MDNKKLKIFFDGEILSAAVNMKAGRSGIFFTAYNILTQFAGREDVEVIVKPPLNDSYRVIEYLKEQFPCSNLHYIAEKGQKIFDKYGYLRSQRIECRSKKMPIKSSMYSILAACLKIFLHLYYYPKYKKQLKNEIAKCDVAFSPFYYPDNVEIKIPKFTILYDTIPLMSPDYFDKSAWFNTLIKSINHDDFYFADSNSARNDFLKYCPQIDPEKITVTPLACNERFVSADENAIAQARKKYNIPEGKKYVFSLCTLEPRKNLIRAVKTFVQFIKKNNIDDLVFVLGGGHWEHFIGKLKNEIADLVSYQDKIIRAGYIDDEDVPRLYSGAEWFVFTSQYEGFGLPPLEAMSCGCPVITSNNSSLPEVVGDAGIMIDFDSDEQHIKAYEDYYFNPALREEYAAKGLARTKNFSWEKCAGEMIDEMKKSLGK